MLCTRLIHCTDYHRVPTTLYWCITVRWMRWDLLAEFTKVMMVQRDCVSVVWFLTESIFSSSFGKCGIMPSTAYTHTHEHTQQQQQCNLIINSCEIHVRIESFLIIKLKRCIRDKLWSFFLWNSSLLYASKIWIFEMQIIIAAFIHTLHNSTFIRNYDYVSLDKCSTSCCCQFHRKTIAYRLCSAKLIPNMLFSLECHFAATYLQMREREWKREKKLKLFKIDI